MSNPAPDEVALRNALSGLGEMATFGRVDLLLTTAQAVSLLLRQFINGHDDTLSDARLLHDRIAALIEEHKANPPVDVDHKAIIDALWAKFRERQNGEH